MKKFKLLKSILVSMFGITTSFGSFTSIASCGNNSASKDEEKKDDEGGKEEVVPVTKIDLDQIDIEMNEGDTVEIKATVLPSSATDKSITWTSGDETVATVNGNGLVTGVKSGETTIIVTSKSNKDISATCKVTVIAADTGKVKVTGVKINWISPIEMNQYAQDQLIANVFPETASNKTVKWTTSNYDIVDIDGHGSITAMGVGEATIKVETQDGNFIDTCTINVHKNLNNFCVLQANENSSLNVYQGADETKNGWLPNLQYAEYTKGKCYKWTELSSKDQTFTIDKGRTYLLKGDNSKGWNIYDDEEKKWLQNGNFKIEGDVALSGSINALIDNGAGEKDITLPSRCFSSLFINSTGITSVDENFLPSTNLGPMCYNGLFNGCSSLTQAPDLPATKLSAACYAYMFENCSSLTSAPDLLATKLVESCYAYMFRYCSKLNRIKLWYEGTAKDAPNSAFKEWVVDVASSGTFYYNGDSTAQNFGLADGWKIYKKEGQDLYLDNGSTFLYGSLNVAKDDSNQWKLIASPSFSDDYVLEKLDIELSSSSSSGNNKIFIKDGGYVSWNSSLEKGTYKFNVVATVRTNNETIDIKSDEITLVIYDDSYPQGLQVGWIGHRGVPSKFFESSIASFECAANDPKYWGIETDVHMTADQQIVCVHDSDCFWNEDRTGKDPNKRVEDLTYDQIKKEWLINGLNTPPYKYPHDCATKQYVPPLFEEYLKICFEHNKVAVIEIKNKGGNDGWFGEPGSIWNESNIALLWKELLVYAKQGLNFNIISFDNLALEYMIEKYNLDENHYQMLINGSEWRKNNVVKIHNNVQWFLSHNYSIDCTDWQINGGDPKAEFSIENSRAMIERFHEKGLKVNIYSTKDDISQPKDLIATGVDYITSNLTYDELIN